MNYHMAISVRGNIFKEDPDLINDWSGLISDEFGEPLKTSRELREFFVDHLSKGHEVIPFGCCENFDYKRGCNGHTGTLS